MDRLNSCWRVRNIWGGGTMVIAMWKGRQYVWKEKVTEQIAASDYIFEGQYLNSNTSFDRKRYSEERFSTVTKISW